MKRGVEVLRDRSISKSTAFTKDERKDLGLRGLLPYAISSQQKQINRVIANIRRKDSDIEKYIFLSALQDRNEKLYYKTLMDNIEELLPIIYTPTVGQVCKEFSQIYRLDKGFFITPEDKGDIDELLGNWPEKDVRVIVITDGQRILGLGDLGSNGMGIPIGKLSLYTAGAGIHPVHCLPVMLDVGTNNEELLNDLLYLGYPHHRLEGDEYFDLLDEFITKANEKYPNVLIQFEDFLTPNAFAILNKYQDKVLCFNDDIQGTAAVALSGVLCSSRITKVPFRDTKIMFLGAGSAATGIADLMIKTYTSRGLTQKEAYNNLWFVDVNGLVVKSRTDLMEHNLPYAHDVTAMNFLDAINYVKPTVLIGASGAGGTFTQEVIEAMCAHNEKPVVFALSNPTSKSECTAEQAYNWSKGKIIFASGSPFDPVEYEGKIYKTGQGNNAYIFPGIGLGAISVKAKYLPEEIFLAAAEALANEIGEDDLLAGTVYPKLTVLRKISHSIAVAVAEKLFEMHLAGIQRPDDLGAFLKDQMYDPVY